MALAIRSAAPLQPELILAQAISEFEQALTPDQKTALDNLRKRSLRSAPSRDDVLRVTADVNYKLLSRRREPGLSRCFGTRFTNVLQCVQRYVALGDAVIGRSQSIMACGVWAVVRLTVHVCVDLGTYLNKVSHFFMIAGLTAPRYELMAHLYCRSNRLGRYLSQYFTVIVKICHDFILFSRKSAIGQLTASLDDSKIRDAQVELDRLAHHIREEVSFLTSEKVEDEAKENGLFRMLMTSSQQRESEQRKVRLKMRLLEALSATEHEVPFRQARNRGTSTVFRGSEEYESWRDSSQPKALLISGKLGAGKSVTMASIVDDLYLHKKDCAVAHVFCRHDNTNSLTARSVIGSLARQLVDKYFKESFLDNLVEGAPLMLDMADALRFSKEAVTPGVQVYIVLDGLDECSRHEANGIITALQSLESHMKLFMCVSCRSGADTHMELFKSWEQIRTLTMPEENPDIDSFIQEELQRRLECGKLALGNAGIILEIRDALTQGANGMFLWVALQLDALCEEKSDRDIRAALGDLPPDLYSTYARILRKSRKWANTPSYQMRILKPIAAAFRPLSVHELREIISVEPGNTSWDPEQLVNDIHSALACCGSLIVVEEEDSCVRMIHQSVIQFLTTNHCVQSAAADGCNFSMLEAQRYMGDCAVTYLNYSLFETRLSSQRARPVLVGQLPNRVIREALVPSGTVGQLALRLLQSASKSDDFDAKRVLAEVANRPQSSDPATIFRFLDYAIEYWLRHTVQLQVDSEAYSLWTRLLENPRFNALIWAEDSAHPQNGLVVDDDTGCLWQLSERVMWAIAHAHIPLLRHEMRGKNWCKAFVTIIPYLKRCMACETRPEIAADMSSVLLPLVAMFQTPAVLEWLLSMGAMGFSEDNESQALVDIDQYYNLARAKVSLDKSLLSRFKKDALLQGAICRRDVHVVRLLADSCRSPSQSTAPEQQLNLSRALQSDLDDPVIIKIIYILGGSRLQIRDYSVDKLVHDIKILSSHVDTNLFAPGPSIVQAALCRGSNVDIRQLLYAAIRHYALRLDVSLLEALLSSRWGVSGCVLTDALGRIGGTSDDILCILLANYLHSLSQQRIAMVRSLFEQPQAHGFGNFTLESAQLMLKRCIQLRHWSLADDFFADIRQRSSTLKPEDLRRVLRQYVIDTELVYLCAGASDHQGLSFMFTKLRLWPDTLRRERSRHVAGEFALECALLADAEDWYDYSDVLKTVDVLLQRNAAVRNFRDALLVLVARFNLLILDDDACLLPPTDVVDMLRSILGAIISKLGHIQGDAKNISRELLRCFLDAYGDYFHPEPPDGMEVEGGPWKPAMDDRRRTIKKHYMTLIENILATRVDPTLSAALVPLIRRMEVDENRRSMIDLMGRYRGPFDERSITSHGTEDQVYLYDTRRVARRITTHNVQRLLAAPLHPDLEAFRDDWSRHGQCYPPPQVPGTGPDKAWLIELVTYNGAPFHDHRAYFVRSRSNKDRGVYTNTVVNVRAGFTTEFERGLDLSMEGNRPTTRVALQWVEDRFLERDGEEGGVRRGIFGQGEGCEMGMLLMTKLERSACKVPPFRKSLHDEVSQGNPGRRVVQRDCQAWIVVSADQLVREGIFKPEVAAYLYAIQQT